MERKIDRLDKYMKHSRLNDNKLTKLAGLTIGVIGKSRKDGRDLSSGSIEKVLLVCADLNSTWLLTGEGEMLKNDETPKSNPIESDIITLPSNPKDLEIIELQRQLISDRDKIIKFLESQIEMFKKHQICFYPKYEENPSSMEVNDTHREYRASK